MNLITSLLGILGQKTDGYKTKIGGVGLILTSLVGLLGLLYPDQGLPQMGIEAVIASFSAGMTVLGLGGKAEKLKNAINGQGGCIRSGGLIVSLLLISMLTLAGCAAWQNSSKAENSARVLLSIQTAIVGVAQNAGEMCNAGKLNADQCERIATIYQKAGPAYDLAAESLKLAINLQDDAGAWQRYQTVHASLFDLYIDITRTASEFGLLPQPLEGGEPPPGAGRQ